jgi:(1->4)-alpha-D-glucan 1-alpha-D-glucosylmutase
MSQGSPFDIPIATYRLQLNRAFGFDRARQILPYLAQLGISHIYCSPFLKARAGSTHGYDVVDYARINPELGGEAGLERFAQGLEQHALGLILDFVPNHMGVGHADNSWWLDVLEWGEASPHSRYFDIDWKPPRHDLDGKVLLPILGASYGAALSAGEIVLRFDSEHGTFDFWYFDHRLPLSPRDYPAILGPLAHTPPLESTMRLVKEAFLVAADPSYRRNAAKAAKEALAAVAGDPVVARSIAETVASWHGSAGEPDSFLHLHEILQRQAYRLAHWRAAADEMNYRRFFDIEGLAGMRMDRIVVFRDTHKLVGRLLARGMLHGLRIDHVDGLAEPQRYCRWLNAFAATIAPRDVSGRRLKPYVVVEKILAHDEKLPTTWPVAGTTGYDYLALVNGLFIDRVGYAKLQRYWSRFAGIILDPKDEIYRCRRLVIDRILSSELSFLVHHLVGIAEADWFTRDFTRKRLRDALVEIVAAFGVYRTYVTERGVAEKDRREIERAIAGARERWVGADGEILDFIAALLTLDIAHQNPGHYAAKKLSILRFVARFQQYTGAIAAKAVEDTFFYRHVPLASANEIGATPSRPTTSIGEFHASMSERAFRWPCAMLASATHDTKRGEDVRARLNVLSEIPDEWARRVARWHIYNRAHRSEGVGASAPSLNDEYLLYQSIVGTFPMQAGAIVRSNTLLRDYVERLKGYAIKACREAKLVSSWVAPNEPYEAAFSAFVDGIFRSPRDSPFIDSLMRFLPSIQRRGAINGLSQLVLKSTLPGVPDFYQGNEFWDLSLVDPDNRRPVDFDARAAALAGIDFAAALARWREGWLKLWVMERILDLRQRLPDLFRIGTYEPLSVDGEAGDCILAFQRCSEQAKVVVLVSRFLSSKVCGDASVFWPGNSFLAGTAIRGVASRSWVDQIMGSTIESCSRGLVAAEALSTLPVAVLLAN